MKGTRQSSRSIGRAFGYSDDDLSTPGHDALVLWLRRNMGQFLTDTIWSELKDRYVQACATANERERKHVDEQRRLRACIGKEGAELTARQARLPEGKRWFHWYRPELEKRVSGGWIDVYVCGDVYAGLPTSQGDLLMSPQRWRLAIEVKTSIRSFGELVRQLRVYESALSAPPAVGYSLQESGPTYIYVASPDDRFAEDLRDQGFGFLKVEVPTEANAENGAG